MKSFVLALAALVGLTVTASAQSGAAGNWTLSFNTPNGTIEASATFKVDGETLTGTLAGPQGETPLKGTVKDRTIQFATDVQTQNGQMTVKFNAEVDGDSVKGTFDFGQGQGEFTGKRKS